MELRIERHKIKGRGVFAEEAVAKGEVIETCELLFLDYAELPPSLEGYVYLFTKKKVALALGNGSLYNHSDHANAVFTFNYRKKLLVIRAKRPIKSGEEITLNYGYSKAQKEKFKIR